MSGKEHFHLEFERRGETWVRHELAMGMLGVKTRSALHWLAERERDSSDRIKAEERRVARSAKNAAWIAATAAIIAAIAAIISAVIAFHH